MTEAIRNVGCSEFTDAVAARVGKGRPAGWLPCPLPQPSGKKHRLQGMEKDCGVREEGGGKARTPTPASPSPPPRFPANVGPVRVQTQLWA